MAKRPRIWKIAVAVVALFALANLAAVYFFAPPIAAAAVSLALSEAGIPHGDVKVTSVSFSGIALAPLQFGERGEIQAEAVVVEWTWGGLRDRRVEHVRIEKPKFQVSIGNGEVKVAGFEIPAGGDRPMTMPFTRLELADAQITVEAAGTTALITGDMTVIPGDGITVAGDAGVALEIGEDRAEPVRVELALERFNAAFTEQRVGLNVPEIGIRSDFGTATARAELSLSLTPPMTVLAQMAGDGELTLVDDVPVKVTFELPVVHVDIAKREVNVTRLDAEATSGLGRLRVAGAGSVAMNAPVKASGNLWLDASLPPGDGAPARVSASVPSWNFDLATREFRAGSFRATATSAFGEADMASALYLHFKDGPAAEGSALLVNGKFAREDAPPRDFSIRVPAWSIQRAGDAFMGKVGRLDAASGDLGVELSNLEVTVTPGLEKGRLSARGDAAPSRTSPANWPTVKFDVSAARSGDLAVLGGSLSALKESVKFAFTGGHDIPTGKGTLQFNSSPIVFSRSFQPRDLIKQFPEYVNNVVGRIEVELDAAYGGEEGIAAHLAIALDGVGFNAGGGRISDIRGSIAPVALLPLSAKKIQSLTGTLHVDPVPPMPFAASFRLPGDDSFAIDRLELEALQGSISVREFSFETNRPLVTEIRVHNADLASVLALIDLEGLSGSGTLSGAIPVRIDGSKVDIAKGSLASTEKGVLRYTGTGLDQAVAAAGAAGDQIDLLRRALGNFHYDALTLDILRDQHGNGVLGLRISGHNPDVLEGHPFNININLETNFDRVAALLLDGYAAADRLMRRGIGR